VAGRSCLRPTEMILLPIHRHPSTVNLSAQGENASPAATGSVPAGPVRETYVNGSDRPGIDLAAALRAIADAGLSPDALATAVRALIGVACPSIAKRVGIDRRGGA